MADFLFLYNRTKMAFHEEFAMSEVKKFGIFGNYKAYRLSKDFLRFSFTREEHLSMLNSQIVLYTIKRRAR